MDDLTISMMTHAHYRERLIAVEAENARLREALAVMSNIAGRMERYTGSTEDAHSIAGWSFELSEALRKTEQP